MYLAFVNISILETVKFKTTNHMIERNLGSVILLNFDTYFLFKFHNFINVLVDFFLSHKKQFVLVVLDNLYYH